MMLSPGALIAIAWAVSVVWCLVWYGLDLDLRFARWRQRRDDRGSLKRLAEVEGRDELGPIDVIDFEAWG